MQFLYTRIHFYIFFSKGGTGKILEYFGSGVESQSCTGIRLFFPLVKNLRFRRKLGLATICNMGAEVGGTTSIFPYTQSMRTYLHATGRCVFFLQFDSASDSIEHSYRGPVASAADWAQSQAGYLMADEEAEYDQVIEVDLSSIEPTLNGPFTPDFATPLSRFGTLVKEKGWKDEISAALIGSCTNSSYEDMVWISTPHMI